MPERRGSITRETTETRVVVEVDLDGGDVGIDSGVPFFDHMLDQVARHARIGLVVRAQGDLEVDAHHTVEDVGIALGEALVQALGDKKGITRYGDATVPMEECLARAALDISGRALLVYRAEVGAEVVGGLEVALVPEFFQALCRSAGLTLHLDLLRAGNAHHSVEALFKAAARALGAALAIDPRAPDSIPSTKGTL